MLAAQDAEAVAKVARVQNERDKPNQNAHKAERKHREAAGRLDGVAHAGIDRIEHEGDKKVEQRQLEGIDLAGVQKRARFGLDRAGVEMERHRGAPFLSVKKSGRASVKHAGKEWKKIIFYYSIGGEARQGAGEGICHR